MKKNSTSKCLRLALAGFGALAATNVMAASPVKIGGQVQTDFANISGDTKYDAAKNWSAVNSSVQVRRADIYLKGELDDIWGYQLRYDLKNNSLEDSWIGFNGFDPLWLAVGKVAVPFGSESFGSSSATTFMERGSVDAFKPADGLGVYAEGQADMLGYSLGVVAPDYSWSHGSDSDRSDPLTYAARLTFAPVVTDDTVYHFGFSYNTSKVDPSKGAAVSVMPMVSVRNTPAVITTQGSMANQVRRTNTWGLEAASTWGPVYAHAEYAEHKLKGRHDVTDLKFKAWFVQASYMLTGEARPYDAKSGTFGRVKPVSNMGAVEVAARYDVFDGSDEHSSYSPISSISSDTSVGKMKDWTLGLNWYANDNVKFQLNYTRAKMDYSRFAKDAGTKNRDLDVLALRTQVRF